LDKRTLDKRTFYRQPDIARSYDRQRFGGPSGERVNQREIELALDMLPKSGRVLDLACGTGRIAAALIGRQQSAIGLDASAPMLALATTAGVAAALGDAFATPFGDGAFDALVSLRFAFHYDELRPLLAEMRRVTRPGGTVVFDTYSWTPRAAVPLGNRAWGGRVHLHARTEVAREAAHAGLRIVRIEPCFLFSPYLYRLAPLAVERAFERLEHHVPSSWLCRVFWGLLRI
jgi:SAM-dependent methyltransferase